MRGIRLNDDDVIRRAVISKLLCHCVLHKSEIESEFGIRFDEYFADELARLEPLQKDGLVDSERRNHIRDPTRTHLHPERGDGIRQISSEAEEQAGLFQNSLESARRTRGLQGVESCKEACCFSTWAVPKRLQDVRPFLYNLFSDPEIIRIKERPFAQNAGLVYRFGPAGQIAAPLSPDRRRIAAAQDNRRAGRRTELRLGFQGICRPRLCGDALLETQHR